MILQRVLKSLFSFGGRARPERALPHPPDPRRPVLIVAGEHSGDLLGADLVAELRRLGFQRFFGAGGERMREEGVELLRDVAEMNVVGFVEAIRAYRRLKAFALRLVQELRQREASMVVLIDYPGFNLRFAQMLQDSGAFVVYLVSPQLWAWKYGRMRVVQETVDLMLPLFPFEEAMYHREGVAAVCIGHPLVHRIPRRLRKEIAPPSRPGGKPIIALLPGSRRSEVGRLIGPMLDAAEILSRAYPRARFLLAGVEPRLEPMIQEALAGRPGLAVEYSLGNSLRILEACDAVIIASGTATLEAAYFTKPMVLMYRVGWLNLFLIAAVIRTRFIGIVNILARRPAVLELLQTEATGENAAREICRILEDRRYREAMIEELDYVRRQLGRGNPAARAAQAIAARIDEVKAQRRKLRATAP